MSKATLETNNNSLEQEKELFNFWDNSFFSDNDSYIKESLQKKKCNKFLKKKLRKYRRRQNGEEDPEVLNVSLNLSKILSFSVTDQQNNSHEIAVNDFDRPQNYLMKMLRQNSYRSNIKSSLESKYSKKNKQLEQNVATLDKRQQATQKNAFQLMMDSRNKSIGGNSPGKEKDHDDDFETEVIIQKKATKSKRKLLLQKMAESKGAIKNKEIEEAQEEIIKQKMTNRAERLKDMIAKNKKNKKPEINKKEETKVKGKEKVANGSKPVNKIMDFNVHVCPDSPVISPTRKKICKEDEEFLNKLSPSIKKKENMLSYFKKIEKETEITPVESNFEMQEVDSGNIIKVKLAPRKQKSSKKKKLSLKTSLVDKSEASSKDCNENNCNSANIVAPEILPQNQVQELTATDPVNENSRKRKRKTKLEVNNLNDIPSNVEVSEGRPRRNLKKPVKYSDAKTFSSSEDELVIFTPKKKKHIDKSLKLNTSIKNGDGSSGVSIKPAKNKENSKKSTKPEAKGKLAPIFAPKRQIDPAALKAKQKFLQSGVPEQLKKIAAQQTAQINNSISFYAVVHVSQDEDVSNMEQKCDYYKSCNKDDRDVCFIDNKYGNNAFFKDLLHLYKKSSEPAKALTPNLRDSKDILQDIKDSYPEFPVYRTYKTLKNKSKGDHTDIHFVEFDNSKEALDATVEMKNEDPKSLCWVDKYRATSTKQIIGNFESIKELRKWLVSWTESQLSSKNSQEVDSDSSDFCNSDGDSRDNAAMTNNLLIVAGPVGCGKTSAVHAAAAELAIKVIEVNVGSRRTGKILLQDLQEATRSHKVNRAKGNSAENSQNSQNIVDLSAKQKKQQAKKSKSSLSKSNSQRSENLSQPMSSQDEGRTGMSLILIDDADIVFEQDDGFISGIAQLIQCSKRPVIIVTSSLSSLNLQRFWQCENVIKLRPLLPRMLGTWLDLVCLADTGASWPGAGAHFLNHFGGDVRKATNYYNYYALSQLNGPADECADDEQKITNCDENSSMSWTGADSEEIKSTDNLQETVKTPDGIFHSNDLDKWWSMHDVFGSQNRGSKDVKGMKDITSALDALSVGDLSRNKCKQSMKSDICSGPWHTFETDSVSERDSLESVNNFHDACSELSLHLVESMLDKKNRDSNQSRKVEALSYKMQRERDKTVSRHKLLTESLVPCSVLDRKAIALDYWPVFRAICRAEKVKTDTNLKRNNRFIHYLKTYKVASKSEVFSKLGDTLQSIE